MNLLLKNSRLIDPGEQLDAERDILIINGVIERIGDQISPPAGTDVLEMSGKIASPGFMDMHVHFREPGFEHKETIETGMFSAAEGGFTAVCLMPNTNPPVDDASVVNWIKERARQSACKAVNVHPIAAITKQREGKELSPMIELAESGAVAFSDDGSAVENAEIMRRALEYSSMLNITIIQHPEVAVLTKGGVMNEGMVSTMLGMQAIPSVAEEIMISRDIILSKYVGARYHGAHVSTAGAVELIRLAKKGKNNVTCEVTPHHFTLSDNDVRSFDTNTKMNPPLRTREDIEAVIEGLRDGTIDVIATDHAPHSYDEKQVEYMFAPFGIVGLETAVGLALSELYHKNVISISNLIEKFSTNPYKILNLPCPKIKEGEGANLTLLDLNHGWIVDIHKFKSKSKNSPFQDRKLKGKAIGIINNNHLYKSGSL